MGESPNSEMELEFKESLLTSALGREILDIPEEIPSKKEIEQEFVRLEKLRTEIIEIIKNAPGFHPGELRSQSDVEYDAWRIQSYIDIYARLAETNLRLGALIDHGNIKFNEGFKILENITAALSSNKCRLLKDTLTGADPGSVLKIERLASLLLLRNIHQAVAKGEFQIKDLRLPLFIKKRLEALLDKKE